ncbi:TetR/AcrR family transcriptional regulator [Sodalis sp. RH16]|uniref:TetR/AcrR family transcriptional regulator n=1 Tax=unclassified Sodalis (in: enterobacteria) TaxID=2636512 RepID=UPI0039B49C3D
MGDADDKLATKRGRPKVIGDEERRRSILRAAHESFVELGFARTTTAMVAARAKVSKRSIYESFGDKTELFAAVIREQRHLILDLPRPSGEELPLLDTLVRIFRLDISEEAGRAREAILNLLVRESVLFPELSDYLYENEVIRSREALIEWLQSEMDRGRMKSDDTSVCAGMLMDCVFGALLPRRRLHNAAERADRTEHIKKRLEIFLRGIRNDPDATSQNAPL